MGHDILIEAHGLERRFRVQKKHHGSGALWKNFFTPHYEEKIALHPLELQLTRGQVVGLIGANGAGKTTLIKLLIGLSHPSAGEVSVLGYRPAERKPEFLKQIGVILGQKNQLWWDLSPWDSFELLATLYDIPWTTAKQRAGELAEMLSCSHVLDTQVRRLSLGERMKMEIISALLHQPEILFLDEPTIGLDLPSQQNIRKFLADYVRQHHPLIILTSHYMADISELAHHLIVLSRGQKVFDGPYASFLRNYQDKKTVSLRLSRSLGQDFHWKSYLIKADQLWWQQEVTSSDLSEFVQIIARELPLAEIQIQEKEFEDVIQNFLR
jgi:ABC-2 type transport system ATP-binding protein